MTISFIAFLVGLAIGIVVYHFRVEKMRLEYRLLLEKMNFQEKHHHELSENLEMKFKNLSHQIFEEKSKRFREDSLLGMELVLNPFREKMNEFQKKVEDMHLVETKDRIKLHSEIERIVMTGQKMSLETENLTRALKGDVKLQGNWGELILERVLESSGLRAGIEFTLQGKEMNLKDEDGRHQMPDAIINLPDQKHLIIDSKVSLIAYERFINENQEEDLSSFLDSLYTHIKGLSSKRYHELDKISTPDYVMLFIPIEGAFMLAIQNDKEIFQYAWEKNILLVSPSTLLATLRTVASLWKQERQTKNALEIAKQAGSLYDKFVMVADDLNQMQSQFRKVSDSFETLRGKMFTGRGSLAYRMENLKELGAKTSKSLDISQLD